MQQALRQRGDLRQAAHGAQQGELIPTQAAHQVLGRRGLLHHAGQIAQRLVTRRVAQIVVDGLEVVHIKTHQPRRRGLPLEGGVGLFQHLHEAPAVVQPRQFVVHGLLLQLLLQPFAGGDVAGHPDDGALAAVRLVQGGDPAFEPDGIHRSVGGQTQHIVGAQFVLDHQHLLAGQRVPDLLQEPVGLGRHQHVGDVLADQGAAVVVVALVLAAQDGRVAPRLRQDEGRVGQTGADGFVLAGREESDIGHDKRQSRDSKFSQIHPPRKGCHRPGNYGGGH